jgi:hypothetical protein
MWHVFTKAGLFTTCAIERDAISLVHRMRKQGTMAWHEKADWLILWVSDEL